MNKVQISVRSDGDTYQKLRYIAKNEERTISRQADYFMRQCIRKSEEENGEIEMKTAES